MISDDDLPYSYRSFPSLFTAKPNDGKTFHYTINLITDLPDMILAELFSQRYLSLHDYMNLHDAIYLSGNQALYQSFIELFGKDVFPSATVYCDLPINGYMAITDNCYQITNNVDLDFHIKLHQEIIPNLIFPDEINFRFNVARRQINEESVISLDTWQKFLELLKGPKHLPRKRLSFSGSNDWKVFCPESFCWTTFPSYFRELTSLILTGFDLIEDTPVVHNVIQCLLPSQQLVELDLSYSLCRGDDELFQLISQSPSLQHLQHLKIDGVTNITNATFEHLSRLPLVTLHASLDSNFASEPGLPISSIAFRSICKISTLESLQLSFWFFLCDEDLLGLKNLPNLKELQIDDKLGLRINDQGLAYIAEFCPKLTKLNLRGAFEITKDGLQYLLPMKHQLKELMFSRRVRVIAMEMFPDCFPLHLHGWGGKGLMKHYSGSNITFGSSNTVAAATEETENFYEDSVIESTI